MISSLRLACAVVLIALLGVLAWQAGQQGMAGLYAKHARSYIAKSAKKQQPVLLDEWRAALNSAESAHRLDRRNPDNVEDLGQLYDRAAYRKPPKHPVEVGYREQALIYFRAAARQRPVSGYTWANIAQEKNALDQTDGELVHALESAVLLGPWEPEVQLAVADAGLALWPRLPDETRQVVRESLVRGMRRQAKDMVLIAKNRDRTAVVCALDELPADARARSCAR